jgi:hypothetical protein
MTTRRGPNSPRCSQTELEPGPPLNANVTGRLALLGASTTYDVIEISAFALCPLKTPSSRTSSRSTTRPVVAV